ncbi:MAG: hypothetical protein E7462_00895 [Ruminococcaceae bacterium]|nr:hypothetical protein [Oscillospiraceae bacterium]
MTEIVINQTQEILLKILSASLAGKQVHIPADTDWSALFLESKAQAVMPMVYSCIAQQCADKEVLSTWKAMTMRTLQKNMRVHGQHGALHKILTAHEIPYCIIKGSASARDYPDPLMRAMGDVDFLVPVEYWEQAKQVLIEDGFTCSGEEHPFHLSFDKKNIGMEMHRDPFGLDEAEKLQEIVPELVKNSVEITCENVTFRMCDAFGHGIVLLLHAYRHLVGAGVGVRHLCDWATFAMQFSNEEFIEIFEKRFRELGIWKLAQIFSTTAHRYLSTPYLPWMGETDPKRCEMFILDILNGGNFGRAGGDRWTQNKAIFTTEKHISETSSQRQMIKSLNQKAMKDYPRLMRFGILRPLGWMLLGVRYVFRVLTGKRKKVPADMMKMVELRKNLYRQLQVFEEE